MPTPVPVGTVVTWTASTSGSTGNVWYRFRTREPGSGEFHTIRDYSPSNSFTWAPLESLGIYEIEVSAADKVSGEISSVSLTHEVVGRVGGGAPVITPTSNPLVYIYSAPPCPAEARIRVQWRSASGFTQTTPFRSCVAGKDYNIYLAGFVPNSENTVQHILQQGQQITTGPALTLSVPQVDYPGAVSRALQVSATRPREGILLQSLVFEYSHATDMNGNMVWYYAGDVTYLTRPEPGGYFFAIVDNPLGVPSDQLLRKINLAGNPVLETNAATVNEQLAALGKRPITGFHHEARALPDGRILVLASTEQILDDVQGPGPMDVIGDMILVLDRDLQVVWTWDAFDHLDVRRTAVLGETCTPAGGGCPPFYLAPIANDWLHGNSLQLTPDGNILYSVRHQDWVIKIDYSNGLGSGGVIWKLGKDGDFTISSPDPDPWFSHQHDANYDATADRATISLFDNGNTRYAANREAHSRGQVLRLDETARTATLLLNADLGEYSWALGSAQMLSNGNYHFDVGWVPDGTSLALEFDAQGNPVSAVETDSQQYRSFRMKDLYTP